VIALATQSCSKQHNIVEFGTNHGANP